MHKNGIIIKLCTHPLIELLIRQQKGLLCPSAVLLAVDDPKPNIGSGSATLNALLCVSEYLAAQEGHKVLFCIMAERFDLFTMCHVHVGCNQ